MTIEARDITVYPSGRVNVSDPFTVEPGYESTGEVQYLQYRPRLDRYDRLYKLKVPGTHTIKLQSNISKLWPQEPMYLKAGAVNTEGRIVEHIPADPENPGLGITRIFTWKK